MSDLAWLDEIERRANAATPGPWVVDPDHERRGLSRRWAWFPAIASVDGQFIAPLQAPRYRGAIVLRENSEFIAHAREDVPSLCRAVRELAEALDLILAFTLPLIDDQDVAALHIRCQGVLGRWKRGGA